MEPINCNANDSSRQIDTKAKRKQQLTSTSYHPYTQRKTNEIKTIKSFARHTHSYWCATVYIQKSVLSQTSRQASPMCVCVSVLFGQSIWVKTHFRGHHFVEGGNNENCAHTLTDALIKHGSKKWKKSKTKRKPPFTRFVYTVVALTRLKRIHLCL